MHDIKYIFSIKIIRQSRGQKKIPEGANYQKALFFKIQGQLPPPLEPHTSALVFSYCAHIS
jgi:hypothetical protein